MNSQVVDNYKNVNSLKSSSESRWDLNLNTLFFYYNTALDLNYLHKSNLEHYSLYNNLLVGQNNVDHFYVKLIDPKNFAQTCNLIFLIKCDFYTPINNYALLNLGNISFNAEVGFIQNFNFLKSKNLPYSLDFSEQTIFSTGFNSLFGAHVANSIVFDNNTMLVFHNILKQEYI